MHSNAAAAAVEHRRSPRRVLALTNGAHRRFDPPRRCATRQRQFTTFEGGSGRTWR